MNRLNEEAAKFVKAEVQQHGGVEEASTQSVTKLVAAKELVRTTIAVDMIDIARGMSGSGTTRAELQRLVAGAAGADQEKPLEALAVPTGKPLSIFDPPSLPAAYTEFLFGDCVPF